MLKSHTIEEIQKLVVSLDDEKSNIEEGYILPLISLEHVLQSPVSTSSQKSLKKKSIQLTDNNQISTNDSPKIKSPLIQEENKSALNQEEHKGELKKPPKAPKMKRPPVHANQ